MASDKEKDVPSPEKVSEKVNEVSHSVELGSRQENAEQKRNRYQDMIKSSEGFMPKDQ